MDGDNPCHTPTKVWTNFIRPFDMYMRGDIVQLMNRRLAADGLDGVDIVT